MQTAELISSAGRRPLHLRHGPDLNTEAVSSVSRWGDPRWVLDNPTKGTPRTQTAVVWDFTLPDGKTLTAYEHRSLLDTFKRFVWSLFAAPGPGSAPMAVGSIVSLRTGLRALICWMVDNGYTSIGQLTPEVLELYRDDIPGMVRLVDAFEDGDELSFSQVVTRLNVAQRLWAQRHALAAAGIKPIPEVPWGGASMTELAAALVTKEDGQILPIPDEVAVPILNSAARVIGTPAEDVILLVQQYYDIKEQHSSMYSNAVYRKMNKMLERFRFSIVPGENMPWRSALRKSISVPYYSREPRLFTSVQILRHLMEDVKAAAVIIVQATTGMRSSEICGLYAGIDAATGLPKCVEVELSLDGLHEVFFVRGLLSKTEETPREVKWVLGLRVSGETIVPLPVRALLVLNRLLEPLRDLSGHDELVLQLGNVGSLPNTSASVHPATSVTLNVAQRGFVKRHVDLSRLPDTSKRAVQENDLVSYRETKGECLRTHQWRKTLAHFVFNTNRTLLPALSQQFHHISIAMTELGYLGRNQALLETFDSVRLQEVTSLLYEMTTDQLPMAGRMGEQIEQNIDEIKSLIADLTPARGWKKVHEFAELNGIRMWFSPHGKCLPLNYTKMRCHDGGGKFWNRIREPNYDTRQPSMCAGCPCFVLDARHVPYWRDRYIENTLAWRRAEECGIEKGFRVIRERAAQAANLLRRLKVDLSEYDRVVGERLDSDRADAYEG